MQHADTWCCEQCPTTTTTSNVGSHRALRKSRPRKNTEIVLENGGLFSRGKIRLIERRPFPSKAGYCLVIQIAHLHPNASGSSDRNTATCVWALRGCTTLSLKTMTRTFVAANLRKIAFPPTLDHAYSSH